VVAGVYDRTESLLLAYLMHVPISATTFILAAGGAPATAAGIKVLVWGALFWMVIAAVVWVNGGRLTRPDAGASTLGATSTGKRAERLAFSFGCRRALVGVTLPG
jgi:hypothetical protein